MLEKMELVSTLAFQWHLIDMSDSVATCKNQYDVVKSLCLQYLSFEMIFFNG